MRPLLILLPIFICFTSCGQLPELSVTEVKAIPESKYFNTMDSSIVFPVFSGGQVSDRINASLQNDLFYHFEIPDSLIIQKALKYGAKNGLRSSSYSTTYSKNTISVKVTYEWLGGIHPNFWTDYFTFSSITGNRLELDSIRLRDKDKEFYEYIHLEQTKQIQQYQIGLKNELENNEIDSLEYQLAIAFTAGYCLEYFDKKNFIMSQDTLEIPIECGFSHYMKALHPTGNLLLTKEELSGLIRKEYE